MSTKPSSTTVTSTKKPPITKNAISIRVRSAAGVGTDLLLRRQLHRLVDAHTDTQPVGAALTVRRSNARRHGHGTQGTADIAHATSTADKSIDAPPFEVGETGDRLRQHLALLHVQQLEPARLHAPVMHADQLGD